MTLIRPTIINNKVWKIELIFDDPQPLEILQQPEQLVKTLRETPSKPGTSTTFQVRNMRVDIPILAYLCISLAKWYLLLKDVLVAGIQKGSLFEEVVVVIDKLLVVS